MYIRKQRLFTPGPTPLLPSALHAMMGSDIHHRTEDFRKLYKQVLSDLQEVLGTSNDVLVLVASGSGGLEAATQNFFSPGDEVLVCSAGKFGERWVEIMKAWGMKATVLTAPYGEVVTPDAVEQALAQNRNFKGVFVQASETSTGAQHDVEAMGLRRQEDERYFRGGRDYRHRHHAARYRRLGAGRRDRRLAKSVYDSARAGFSRHQPESLGACRYLQSAAFLFRLEERKEERGQRRIGLDAEHRVAAGVCRSAEIHQVSLAWTNLIENAQLLARATRGRGHGTRFGAISPSRRDRPLPRYARRPAWIPASS